MRAGLRECFAYRFTNGQSTASRGGKGILLVRLKGGVCGMDILMVPGEDGDEPFEIDELVIIIPEWLASDTLCVTKSNGW
jgi:hypothetical protein